MPAALKPNSRCAEQELLEAHGIAAERVSAPFPIWLVSLRQANDQIMAAYLSHAERVRAARFRRREHRERYAAAHLARRLLGQAYLGIRAERQEYQIDVFGKPQLRDRPDAQCSISYSGNIALVAWSHGERIGVDAEFVRAIEDGRELLGDYFTSEEGRALGAMESGSPAFHRSFLTVWVRKEACVKAIGRGLNIAPSSFECGLSPAMRQIAIDGEMVDSQVLVARKDLLVSWARCDLRVLAETSVAGGRFLDGRGWEQAFANDMRDHMRTVAGPGLQPNVLDMPLDRARRDP